MEDVFPAYSVTDWQKKNIVKMLTVELSEYSMLRYFLFSLMTFAWYRFKEIIICNAALSVDILPGISVVSEW